MLDNDHGGGATPVPIPNTEDKPASDLGCTVIRREVQDIVVRFNSYDHSNAFIITSNVSRWLNGS